MSFLLLAAPLLGVSFGAGYFYGSYTPTTPTISQELIVEIQKGVSLKRVEVDKTSKVVWTDHDALLREINQRPVLKPTQHREKPKSQEDVMFEELKEILKSRRQRVLEGIRDEGDEIPVEYHVNSTQ